MSSLSGVCRARECFRVMIVLTGALVHYRRFQPSLFDPGTNLRLRTCNIRAMEVNGDQIAAILRILRSLRSAHSERTFTSPQQLPRSPQPEWVADARAAFRYRLSVTRRSLHDPRIFRPACMMNRQQPLATSSGFAQTPHKLIKFFADSIRPAWRAR